MNRISFQLTPAISIFVTVFSILTLTSSCLAQTPIMKNISTIKTPPLIVGHRGATGLMPENTLAGFKLACEIGVDAIELDVLMSASGELVVYHDYALKPEITRENNGAWIDPFSQLIIKDLSLDQIKSYDVGRLQPYSSYAARYPDQMPVDGQRIPTFQEVIDLFEKSCPSSTRIFVEIKTSPEQPDLTPPPEIVCDKVISILKEKGFAERAWILSFDWRNLVYFQKTAPEFETVYLTIASSKYNTLKPNQFGASRWMAGFDIDDFNGSAARAVKAAGGRVWSPYYKNLTPELLAEAHRLGLIVSVWTPDEPYYLEKMIQMGVDAITTNRPDVLGRLLKLPLF
jgi:glycerophosphoryl diester phosphodiesterase